MTDIDTETGLPELPEGYYWKVCGFLYGYRHEPLDEPYIAIAIYHKYQKPRSQWVPLSAFQRFLDALPFVEIQHREIDVIVDYDDEVYFDRIVRKGADGNYVFVHPDKLTPEILLEAAQKALDSWNSQKISRSLLGSYPPNKLEVDSD